MSAVTAVACALLDVHGLPHLRPLADRLAQHAHDHPAHQED